MGMGNSAQKVAELIAVGKDAVRRGLVLASAGNVSVRLTDDTFAVSGAGTWFDQLTPESFTTMNLAGEVLSGPKPSSEWKLHQRAYLARPDAECVIHLHPQKSTMLATLNVPIRLLTLDHAYYVRSVGITEFYPNGSDELADTAAEQLKHHNCVLMKHHGCSVVADSVSMAYRRALNLENAAEATLLALQLGDTDTQFPDLDSAHHD